MIRYLKSYFLIVFFSFIYCDFNDELWTNFELIKNLSPKTTIKLGQHIRIQHTNIEEELNSKHLSSFHVYETFTNLSLSYKISKIIGISGQFRYILDDNRTKRRLNIDIKINLENIKNIRFFPRYRLRLQRFIGENKKSENFIIRNKIKHKYPLKNKFTPFSSLELFHINKNNSLIFDKYRLGFGVEYKANKNQTAVLYYLYESELYYIEALSSNPIYTSDGINIFGLKFEYSL